MPEGHTVHRLAHAFAELLGGEHLDVTSPQGRFADGAALLDGQALVATEAHGKHLFLGFAPEPTGGPVHSDSADPPEDVRWLRVHLGLYGSWTFAGDSTFHAPHAIGAPRRRVAEEETALAVSPDEAFEDVDDAAGVVPGSAPAAASTAPAPGGTRPPSGTAGTPSVGDASPSATAGAPSATAGAPSATAGASSAGDEAGGASAWRVPAPRGAVRVRLLGEHGVADLTGPTACEVITPEEKAAVHARLGPDPLRPDGDGEEFVRRVRARRRAIGELLMDQAVIAGVGNIYRAEALYRARVNPYRLGRDVPAARLRGMWTDLAALMADGVATGRIVTTRPEDRHEDDDRWYVYHRSGLPCLVCGTRVTEADMSGRRLFWCPRCQRAPRTPKAA